MKSPYDKGFSIFFKGIISLSTGIYASFCQKICTPRELTAAGSGLTKISLRSTRGTVAADGAVFLIKKEEEVGKGCFIKIPAVICDHYVIIGRQRELRIAAYSSS